MRVGNRCLRHAAATVIAATLASVLAACSSSGGANSSAHPPSKAELRNGFVVMAAGDISVAGHPDASHKTAALIVRTHPAAVLTLGDNQYNKGAAAAFAKYFAHSWGKFKQLIHPAPGHHEYYVDHTASGYFGYFGAAANNTSQPNCKAGCEGYYSFNLGSWHLIALNTNHYVSTSQPKKICAFVACNAHSPQVKWLRGDLAANTRPCVLAYWSDPRWSSGKRHSSNTALGPIWHALYAAHADVVLNGHEHMYERFAKQNPKGQADSDGIREFVAGTGGNELYPLATPLHNSEVRNNTSHGVLELVLHPHGYTWWFRSVDSHFVDSGTTTCNPKA